MALKHGETFRMKLKTRTITGFSKAKRAFIISGDRRISTFSQKNVTGFVFILC
jgi:hypothetical protein